MHNILIIDDEPLNIKLVSVFLEEQPYKLYTAANSLEAWQHLNSDTKFSLILLDRMLPEVDGLELAKAIRTIDKFKYIPIIMQTAAAEKSQIAEGTHAKISYYLTKPYDAELLIETVAKCLAGLDNPTS